MVFVKIVKEIFGFVFAFLFRRLLFKNIFLMDAFLMKSYADHGTDHICVNTAPVQPTDDH